MYQAPNKPQQPVPPLETAVAAAAEAAWGHRRETGSAVAAAAMQTSLAAAAPAMAGWGPRRSDGPKATAADQSPVPLTAAADGQL